MLRQLKAQALNNIEVTYPLGEKIDAQAGITAETPKENKRKN